MDTFIIKKLKKYLKNVLTKQLLLCIIKSTKQRKKTNLHKTKVEI